MSMEDDEDLIATQTYQELDINYKPHECGYTLKLIISNDINDIRTILKSNIYKIKPRISPPKCYESNNENKIFELKRKFFIDNGLPTIYTARLSRTHIKIITVKMDNNNNDTCQYTYWLEDVSSNGVWINKQQCAKGKLIKLNNNDTIKLLSSSQKANNIELSYRFQTISSKKRQSIQNIQNNTIKRMKVNHSSLHDPFFGITILIAAPLVYRDAQDNKLVPLTTINYIRERRAICNAVDQAYRTRCELNQPSLIHLKIYHCVATISNLRQVLIEDKSKILHFSGHGEENILSLEDGYGGLYPLHHSVLLKLLKQIKPTNLEMVVLGACNSEFIGQIFIQYGVKYVVAIAKGKKIREESTYIFFDVFYHSLAIGRSIENSFNLAKASLTDSIRLLQIGVLDLENESNKFLLLCHSNASAERVLFPTPKVVSSTTLPKPFVSALKMLDEKSDELALPPAPLNLRGRNVEIFKLINLVLKCKWTNINGKVGIGKTGFALTVAHYIQERQLFDNGVIFIEATSIQTDKCLLHKNCTVQQGNQCNNCIVSNIANRIGCICWENRKTVRLVKNDISRSLSCPTTTVELAASDFRLKQSADYTCYCNARKKKCLLFIDDCDKWLANLGWTSTLFKLFARLSIVTISNQKEFKDNEILKVSPVQFSLNPLVPLELLNILLTIAPRSLSWEDCNISNANENSNINDLLDHLSQLPILESLNGNLYLLSDLASKLGESVLCKMKV